MKKTKNNLIGKTVMNENGIPIGVIKKSLVNTISGEITSFLITPSHKIDSKEYKQNKQGEIFLPIDCVSKVKNIIIFEKKPIL